MPATRGMPTLGAPGLTAETRPRPRCSTASGASPTTGSTTDESARTLARNPTSKRVWHSWQRRGLRPMVTRCCLYLMDRWMCAPGSPDRPSFHPHAPHDDGIVSDLRMRSHGGPSSGTLTPPSVGRRRGGPAAVGFDDFVGLLLDHQDQLPMIASACALVMTSAPSSLLRV